MADDARVLYTLYNSNFERVISDSTMEEAAFPDRAGLYLLIFTVELELDGEFSGQAYIFKVRK